MQELQEERNENHQILILEQLPHLEVEYIVKQKKIQMSFLVKDTEKSQIIFPLHLMKTMPYV